ncbi:MAG: chemotaxis protein CheD [Phycisphaerae bacterium]
MAIIVNVSDARASADPAEQIVTYSLGSCIGVTLFDPVARCGGMLHYQLPTSTLDAKRAAENPCMFADTGMAYLIGELERMGGQKKRMKVKVAGGAEILNDAGLFSIGKRNHTAIRKILWQQGLMIEGEDVGGKSPRTLYLHIADGNTLIKTQGETKTL